ncbi:MAG: hypothetical protein JNJ56_08090 [Ignavibacteria bacterium]|nr:hypothetical protein [Ignavibacteria bacterium]
MKKVIIKIFPFLFLAILFSSYSEITNAGVTEVKPDYIYGKVVYSDNNNPVNTGFVKIYLTDEFNNEIKILCIEKIGGNGVFRIPKEYVLNSDHPKIMAYANDYDNANPLFKTFTSDISSVMKKSGDYDMIISVDRNMKLK